MAGLLILGFQRRIEVLAKDADTREAVIDWPRLRLGNGLFQSRNCGVSLACLRCDEAQGDQLMRIAQLLDVIPVSLVEAG